MNGGLRPSTLRLGHGGYPQLGRPSRWDLLISLHSMAKQSFFRQHSLQFVSVFDVFTFCV